MSDIRVTAEPFYLAEQSEPDAGRHVFAYRIRIENRGEATVQLMDRHWLVDHGDGHVEEVRGEGVVGEKPRLAPGRAFEYASGAVIRTPAGAMHGEYGFVDEGGRRFTVAIPHFDLVVPRDLRTLH
ncbi:MAG: Co2+/Mg2+ efflux protein ApaG [Halothiobacillaceae bacterium]